MDESNFDLRTFLADRAYPTSTTRVLMSEKLGFQIAAVQDKLARTSDEKLTAKLEKELEGLEEQRESEFFTFHLRGVSRRKREDIQSASMHAFPYKFDLYGRDDAEQQVSRQRLLEELIFHAFITKVVWPNGKEQVVTHAEDGENGEADGRTIIRSILDNAPDFAIAHIGAAIDALTGDEAVARASVDVDF